jgi:hypothetical protein
MNRLIGMILLFASAALGQSIPMPGPGTPHSTSGGATGCTASVYGAFTCIQKSNGSGFSSPSTVVMSGNLTAGSMVVSGAFVGSTTGTLIPTGCGLTWTTTTVNSADGTTSYATAPNAGTAACTITWTASVSGTIQAAAVEVKSAHQIVNATPTTSAPGFVSTGSTITTVSLTTTVNGDFIVSFLFDVGLAASVYTAGGTSQILVQSTSFGIAALGVVQATAGAITQTATSSVTSTFITAMGALEP